MRTDDGSIIQECLNGKPQAFGVLVDKYREGIYAYIYAELRDFQDAQDVTQEVFLHAYRDLRSLRRWESFAFWLYRIAHRRCVQWFRARSKRVDREFIEDQAPEAIDAPSLDSYRESQLSESVQEALDSLPRAYREVIMLRYFGGMNSSEMARSLSVSPAAIRKRLSRARAQMKEEMIAMMDTAFEGQKLPVGFTFRIVESIKNLKIQPMTRATALPWGLSLAAGIILTIMSLSPYLSSLNPMSPPVGSPLPAEMKVMETGEIPVDVLKISQMPVLASKQDDGDGGEPAPPNPQNAALMAAQGGIWARKEDMPTARYIDSACVVDGLIYAIGGGRDGVNFVPPVETYDPVADIWVKKEDMPVAKNTATSVVDGIIYVIGGLDAAGLCLSTVEAYDPAEDAWAKKEDMPTARNCLSTCVVNGIIYAIGGYIEGGEALSTVEAYDPDMNVWEKKEDMPTARKMLSTSVVDGIIYAIGGRSTKGNCLSTVEAYDPAIDTWTTKNDMLTARRQFAIAAVNGIIYAIGGSDNIKAIPVVEAYDPVANAWIGKANMPTARAVFTAGVVNGKIYTIGGTGVNGNWNSPVAIVEEYTPDDWQPEVISPQGKLPTTWGETKSN